MRSINRTLQTGLSLATCFAVSTAEAFWAPPRQAIPNFDSRPLASGQPATAQRAAMATLQAQVPDFQIQYDERLGTPKWVSAQGSFLTGPGAQGLGVNAQTRASLLSNEDHLATKAFLKEHKDLFGYGPEILTDAQLKQDSVTAHNGLRTVIWQQSLEGIEVFDGLLISHTTKEEELVSISSQFIPRTAEAAESGVPNHTAAAQNPIVSAAEAISVGVISLGEPLAVSALTPVAKPEGPEQRQQFTANELNGAAEVKLVWLPMSQDSMRLCWHVELTSKARSEMFRLLVDAESGELLVRQGLTEYLSDASFRVFTSDSPSPFSPGCSTPCTTQPSIVSRALITWSALDTNASPNGWIDDGVNETRGNNVDAHTDRDANDSADLPRPQGSPFRTFDFTLDLTQAPQTYTNAAVTELFYWNNWMHDKLYALGFTEAGRNFQNTNFGRGGLGNDAVQADAQDGSGTDNANFSTPSDGSPGRMQMYLFSGPTPDRDGDFDHEVVLHEYTHGLSNRRIGGGVGLSSLQSRGMGEGWSDWYGLTLLSESGDDVNAVYAAGAYATYQLSGMTSNYYFGIRRYPYCTDMTKNPLTFKDIDPSQASAHTGIPRSPIIGTTADEVHNQGEVWCMTLWEARASLITKYGYAIGNDKILRLVTDGLNLTPANPNFLQARDAILQASLVYDGGADLPQLWSAFAKRGMGFSATSPSSSATAGLVEAYDVPDNLFINPISVTVAGQAGGPFSPNPVTLTLTNLGTTNLSWSLISTSSWISLAPTNGLLVAGGAAATVTATILPVANSLTPGTHPIVVRFSNETTHVVQNCTVALNVVGLGMADHFDPNIDLTQWSAFGGTVGSTVMATSYGGYISPPYSLWFGDAGERSATTIPINTIGGGGFGFSIRLANGASSPWEQADALPNEGVVFESSTNNGVSWVLLGSYDTTNNYNWTTVTSTIPTTARGPATLFRWRQKSHSGSGFDHWALDNVVISADNPSYLTLSLPAVVREGDGSVVAQVSASPVPTNNLIVNLTSVDTSELTVPATVTILAGQSNATFNVSVVNDTELDGTQLAQLTVGANGYSGASGFVTVLDNETAILTVNAPANVTEGDGTLQGTITASAAPTANIVVSLSSSDTSEIQVPASVVLPAGQTSVPFSLTVINDSLIDGNQIATITAQVTNWTAGVTNITVHDNEPTNLIVTLPASAREGNGVLLSAGAVRIGGTLTSNLTVSLVSSDTTELTVPPTATILAGQVVGAFDLTIIDDPIIDGSQTVTVTASAPGFGSGATNMVVTDDESPMEPFGPSPADLATNVVQTSDLAWQSGAVSGETITNDVYFGTNPTPGPAEFQGSTTNTIWVLPTLYPQTTYYWQIVARKAGVTPGPIWRFSTRGVDHFVWNAISSPQYVGEPFSVTVTAKDAYETTVSNFSGTVNLSGSTGGAPVTNMILGNVSYTSYSSGTYTLAIGFTPSTNLTVTHVRSYSGTKVSIWTSSGVLVASQNVSGPAGIWTETALPAPVTLSAGVSYRVGFYTGGSSFYYLSGGRPSSFPNGTVDSGYYYLGADGFPATFVSSTDVYLCDLRYTVAGAGPVAITPLGSAPFANGTWTGNLSVLQPATNAVLRAADAAAHVGDSGAFSVALRNDIAVNVTDAPDPVSLGGNITYTINVTNIGPSIANNVVVTNLLPAGVVPGSVTTSQGSVSSVGNLVVANLNALTGGSFATVTIVATATNTGTLTNQTFVSRSDPDAYAANNSATNLTAVQTPVMTISDATIYEGNTGSTNEIFTVQITPAPAVTTTVNFATANGTAVAPGDYFASNGVLTFAPGESNKTISVIVNGDTLYEANETFYVNLSNPVNVTLADSQGLGTILNDDPMPTLSIGDVVLQEGNVGATNAVFPVTLSTVSGVSVSASYSTASGSATSGSDFIAVSGSFTIPAGSTTTNVTVQVSGDLQIESDEVFYIDLYSALNAILYKREGIGFILNDDGLPGNLDHFTWNVIPSPQYVGQPFGVTVAAWDAYNNPAFNFNGSANLSAASGLGATNIIGNGTSIAGFPLYTSYDDERTQVIYLPSEVGGAGRIAAIGLNVNTVPGLPLSNWTIRMKHTPLTNYTTYSWESTGWTVVYQTNQVVSTNGWVVFVLQTPFDYNGSDSLMVDFSFNNSTYSGSGYCLATSTSYYRTLYYNAYSSYGYGDPLTWSGSTPYPYSSTYIPNLMLIRGDLQTTFQPSVVGPFTNGLWTGNLAVMAPATNLIIRADDGVGHAGNSSALNVLLRNDIGLTMTDSPDPVAIGGSLTNVITVTNTGPTTATGVTVTNVLPAGVTFSTVMLSQGTYSVVSNTVIGVLGTLPGGSSATMTVVVIPGTAGTLTSTAVVRRNEVDTYLGNNSASATTVVLQPSIWISDVTLAEGNSGTTNAQFTVSVTPAPAVGVSVQFSTLDGSAIAPDDYIATNGVITFGPGETNKTLNVRVNGDTLYESTESFYVNLVNATNASIADSQAIATILNDDPLPVLTISDASVVEGNAGITNMSFVVTLSPPSGLSTYVYASTVNGSATAPADYQAVSSSYIQFLPGETNKTVVVQVNGDTLNEYDEVFYVTLGSASGATIGDSQGVGTIINDDFVPTVSLSSVALVAETCSPGNGAVDPGEYVTFNVSLTNSSQGAAVATNVTATLLAGGGILGPSGPQSYGALAPGGGNVSRAFSFTASGNCGDQLTATLQLSDGSANLGTVTFAVRLGALAGSLMENFDAVTAPALPAGWTATWSGAGSPWATSTTQRDTLPNAAFCPDPSTTSSNALTSPSFVLITTNALLTFRHYYSTESCCDHCYLQISTGGGSFLDITAAGGAFITNGYASSGWSGTSAGFITTIARLPASSVGQSVRLRWYFTSDSSVSGVGWYVDSIALGDGYTCCQADDLSLTLLDNPDPVAVGGTLTYSLIVSNPGPSTATGTIITNTLPAGATFVSAAASQGTCSNVGNLVICNLGTLTNASMATASIRVTANALGFLTNRATVFRNEPDPIPQNNTMEIITAVVTPSLSISNTSVLEGNAGTNNASFIVTLLPPPGAPVSVHYATADGTAQAGSDYIATNGTLSFAAGQTNQTILVQVVGDTNAEPNETFYVTLSSPTNATIATAVGTGTIVNDETFGRVAVYGAESTLTWNEDVRQKIQGAGNFVQVDAFSAQTGYPVPTLAQLQQYDAVLVYSDTSFNDAVSFGNVLADYVDGGGGVVVCTFAIAGVPIQGRLGTGGYLPITPASQDQPGGLILVPDMPSHEILSGVTNFNGGTSSYHSTGLLSTGAVLVAHWSNNRPLVATKEVSGQRVVALNFFPPSSTMRTDFWSTNTQGGLLMANALKWAANSGLAPVITNQPLSLTVAAGSNASFTVGAAGTAPLRYQWRKNLSPMSGKTNATLALPGVQTNDAGSYSVIVSNDYGYVTSSNVALAVIPSTSSPPVISRDWGMGTNGQYQFTVTALSGSIVVIEASTDLKQWVPVHTNLMDQSGSFLFRDLQTGGYQRRFYRARSYQGSLPPPVVNTRSGTFGYQSGHLGFDIGGAGGQTVVVEASTNLLSWLPLQTNTLTIGPLYFSDPNAGAFTRRFYRVRVQP